MRRCIQVFIAAIAMCTSCIVIVYKDTSEAPTVDAHRRLVVPSATTDTAGRATPPQQPSISRVEAEEHHTAVVHGGPPTQPVETNRVIDDGTLHEESGTARDATQGNREGTDSQLQPKDSGTEPATAEHDGKDGAPVAPKGEAPTLEWLFGPEGRHPSHSSKPHVHISDTLIKEIGPDILNRRPPYDRPEGKHFRARWSGKKNWTIVGYETLDLDAFKRCLDGKWLHVAGDSTGEQLFNSLVVTLDPSHHHKLVTSYDQCVPKYHMRRMALLKSHPKNKTAIWENQLWLCNCRQHSLWWEQTFTKAKDGFDFRITYSYKELMYEAADHGLLQGQWDKQKVNGHVVGNLFDAWKEKMPDIWIANSGAHTFHIPDADIDEPPEDAYVNHAHNITRFAALVQNKYLSQKGLCFLWKANNVPPTHKCPTHHFALNFVTVPAMLRAGFNVIDPEELSSRNPGYVGKPCDIHQAPQDKIPVLALSGVCHACCSG
uniref:Uncharacterized protein n=1 Tax=Eutreptiella gymnastica TaxID=73025 RepID=A0A7S4FQQ0_9EUGL